MIIRLLLSSWLLTSGVISSDIGVLDPAQVPLTFSSNTTEPSQSCHDACIHLAAGLDSQVHYPTVPPHLKNDFFSAQQQEVTPLCWLLPTSPSSISLAVSIISKHDCPFAIKSGGHTMYAGASNSPGGITLDLREIKDLEISEDRETAWVGTGNRWGDVYGYLEEWNRTAVGGRDADVGVGGFLLGGGISYHTRRKGWGCDNVLTYELVLANGSISNISYTTHPDLYWALRGGGSNFGIVTRFQLEILPEQEFWGGYSVLPLGDTPSILSSMSLGRPLSLSQPMSIVSYLSPYLMKGICALGYCMTTVEASIILSTFPSESALAPDASAYTCLVFLPHSHTYILAWFLYHGGATPSVPAVRAHRSPWSTWRNARHSAFAAEIEAMNERGKRVHSEAVTFQLDAELLQGVMRIFMEELERVRWEIEGIMASMPTQVITAQEIAQSSKRGGNSLGMKVEDAPLVHISIYLIWKKREDDEVVDKVCGRMMERMVTLGKELGKEHRFVYQNYAGRGQDVFEGYGEENRARLSEVQKRYDPEGVWERLNSGGFKV